MKQHRDYGMVAIVTLVVVIAGWLLLMPLVPAIASATLHRFHLRSGSFLTWAAQFPIPAMYNFANRYEVSEKPILEDEGVSPSNQRYVNHFPVRIFTFADGRYVHLRHEGDRWLTVESSYRGQTLRSHFHAERKVQGRGFELRRLDESKAAQ